ncbi:MAG: hypothetical protein J7L39_02515 [Candidatus Aenigmarchaeota archaeon]|nr:hypothetical protein [Candidatus Aenigmarchaeota archaeon]
MRSVLGTLKRIKIKGKTKLDTLENISCLGIFVGAILLSLGIALTSITSKGMPVLLSMSGAFFSFLFTVVLIFVWLLKELR